MIRNYLLVALRTLRKQKFYSGINILGLSIGLTCFLFIALFVKDELSYDQPIGQTSPIYRADFTGIISGNELITALMSPPAANDIKNEYPEVVDAFRFRTTGNWFLKKQGEIQTFKEENVSYADPNMFTFWDTPLIHGDPKTCLSKPKTLVMDETTARKIFGEANPLGQIVTLDNKDEYEVTGVYKDFPQNIHFHFNVLLSMVDKDEANRKEWMSQINFNTYLKLSPETNPKNLESKLQELLVRKMGPEIEKYMGMSFTDFGNSGNMAEIVLFPLKDIHLHSDKLGEIEANGDIKYVYIFSAIGIFILLLACINFMNLATARSANRAKEVGMRKVMGAFRKQLIGQFISESVLISIISTILAFGMAAILLSSFDELAGKNLVLSDLLSSDFIIVMFTITVLVGLLAGSYPAFYLSKFRPVETLKGKVNLGFKSSGIRSVLVVLQFTVSIIMIVGTAVVFDQLSFIQNKKLGFDKSQIVMVHDAWILDKNVQPFKNEVKRDSRIISGTVASFLPVNTNNNNNLYYVGKQAKGDESHIINNQWIDLDYIPTLGMEMAEGRAFSKEFPSDSNAILINEATVRQLGLTEPIGSYLSSPAGYNDQLKSYKVIGVIKDFHYRSLKDKIDPMVFHLGESNGFVSFKIDSSDPYSTVDYIRGIWDEFAPGQPFAYSFLDERFDKLYASEQQIGRIFGIFAFLAIFIACLGLFGLASFTAEQRRKEIGIRKVLGASVANIVNKLSLSFIKLVIVSFIIASPIAYFAMQAWLDDFSYRTSIHIWTFLMAGIGAASIAWLTMGLQSWKAARANPVNSLRNE